MIKGTIYYYKDNSDGYEKYIGECDANTSNPKGYGIMYYQDGRVYEGQWEHIPKGRGKMTYPDGRVVVGEFNGNTLVR